MSSDASNVSVFRYLWRATVTVTVTVALHAILPQYKKPICRQWQTVCHLDGQRHTYCHEMQCSNRHDEYTAALDLYSNGQWQQYRHKEWIYIQVSLNDNVRCVNAPQRCSQMWHCICAIVLAWALRSFKELKGWQWPDTGSQWNERRNYSITLKRVEEYNQGGPGDCDFCDYGDQKSQYRPK